MKTSSMYLSTSPLLAGTCPFSQATSTPDIPPTGLDSTPVHAIMPTHGCYLLPKPLTVLPNLWRRSIAGFSRRGPDLDHPAGRRPVTAPASYLSEHSKSPDKRHPDRHSRQARTERLCWPFVPPVPRTRHFDNWAGKVFSGARLVVSHGGHSINCGAGPPI